MTRNKLRAWIAIQELHKHPVSLLPFFLGTVLAYSVAGRIDWGVFGVALAALFLLTNGTYISNEHFDYENDKANVERIGGHDAVGVTTTGGTRVLVRGDLTRREALVASIVCFALAVPLGLVLQFVMDTGPLTVPLGVFGILVGWCYTAPPVRAAYRGFGEVLMAVGYALIVFGGYYIQEGLSWLPVVVSLPWFVAIPALKILREFPDYDADEATEKRNMTVQFGRERMAVVYSALIVLAILLFIPIYPFVRSVSFLISLLPVAFLVRSVVPMVRGEWRDPRRLEAGAVSGFLGMLLIPLALTFVFLLRGVG